MASGTGRQRHGKRRSAAGSAFDRDCAMMGLDNLLHKSEPDTASRHRAHSIVARAPEAFKNVRAVLFRNPYASIGDPKNGILATPHKRHMHLTEPSICIPHILHGIGK